RAAACGGVGARAARSTVGVGGGRAAAAATAGRQTEAHQEREDWNELSRAHVSPFCKWSPWSAGGRIVSPRAGRRQVAGLALRDAAWGHPNGSCRRRRGAIRIADS